MKKRRSELLEVEITHIEKTRGGVFAEAIISGSYGARRISFAASVSDAELPAAKRPVVDLGYCIQHPGDADNRRLAKALCALRKESGKVRVPLCCLIDASATNLCDTILNEGECLSDLDQMMLRRLANRSDSNAEAVLVASDPVMLAEAVGMYFRLGIAPWNPSRYEVKAERTLFEQYSPKEKPASRPGNPVSAKQREAYIAAGEAKRAERAAERAMKQSQMAQDCQGFDPLTSFSVIRPVGKKGLILMGCMPRPTGKPAGLSNCLDVLTDI